MKCSGAGTFLDLYHRVASGTAQGGSSSTIQLAASENFVDDALNTANVHINGGTGAGQVRSISDYVGATDTATVSPNWTISPNSTSTYEVNWDVLGTGNKINVTASNTTKTIDLDPTGWDDTNNQIYVNGVLQMSP
jgi:hypothetical protein